MEYVAAECLQGCEIEYDVSKNVISVPYAQNFSGVETLKYILIRPQKTRIFDFKREDFRYYFRAVNMAKETESIVDFSPTNDEKDVIFRVVWNHRNIRNVLRCNVETHLRRSAVQCTYLFDSYCSGVYYSVWNANGDVGEDLIVAAISEVNIVNPEILIKKFKKID